MLKPSKTRSPGKVLIVPKTSYSRAYKAVSQILAAHRIGYKSTVAGKNLPDLIKVTKGLGKYGVIFFEDYRSYLDMDPWNRDLLDKYCNSFGVGIIAFIPSDEKHYVNTQFHDKSGKQSSLPTISTLAHLKAVEIQADSSILRLTKSGISAVEYDNSYWVAMSAAANSDNFEPVAMGHFQNSPSDLNVTQVPIVLLDKGKEDGIPKVLFGSGLSRHWLYRLLFLDALQYLSNGLITVPLIRHILVDIDDIFVGSNRLTVGDVRALIETQDTLEAIIPGFRYNLGFSGKTYKVHSTKK
jgi:heparan sulfate N-deacetylase/N-sulfotransferase NDST2